MKDTRDIQATIKRVDALAHLLDTRFRVPGTPIRFGLDAVISILPVAGDTVALVIGLYIVRESVRHGVPVRVIARMLLNLGIDWLVGLVPLIGIVPDVLYKANSRNAALRAALDDRLLLAEQAAAMRRASGG